MQHIKYDLGHLTVGAFVIVTLGQRANVLLMDASNYSNYAAGRRASYFGGNVHESPARIRVPRSGRWILAIDLGGRSGQVRHSVRVEGPPRGDLPRYVEQRPAPLNVAVREPAPPVGDEFNGQTWDVFISHASEDKAAVALPLHEALKTRGVSAWLDSAELKMGDSLRRRIDRGIRSSRFAIIVLSENYFKKGWTQYELDGIVTLGVGGRQSLLPIWHNIGHPEVAAHSPSLADKLARSTAETSIDEIADEIAELVMS